MVDFLSDVTHFHSFSIMIRIIHMRTQCNSSDATLYVIETQYITMVFLLKNANNSRFHTLTIITIEPVPVQKNK